MDYTESGSEKRDREDDDSLPTAKEARRCARVFAPELSEVEKVSLAKLNGVKEFRVIIYPSSGQWRIYGGG